MKPYKNWSYTPYKPLLFPFGDIYICRVAPAIDSITFDWLPLGDEQGEYMVCFRERGSETFVTAGQTNSCTYTIEKLDTEHEYEFFVACGEKKSRVRLARCGESFGTVVNYLHPEDKYYSFSGKFLCSPSLVRHPEGYLLASMDLYADNYPQNVTLIYRSDDDGKTWNYVSELFPCFWGKMFIYNGELYMLANSTEYGDILIGKSADGGKTFTQPTVLMRGSGREIESGCHRTPMPIVERDGRIWSTVEWGCWAKGFHAVMVMSAPIGSDLLDADSWTFSEPVKYNPEWPGLPEGKSIGNMEGNLVEMNGKFCNIMRYDMSQLKDKKYGLIMAYEIDTAHPEAPLTFYKCIEFDGNNSKFQIVYDPRTKKYYTLASRITNPENVWDRSLLSLMMSDDCEHWEVKEDIIDRRDDPAKVGFQYVDHILEGDKLLFLCRTAINGADTYHNSNYSIFGTIQL